MKQGLSLRVSQHLALTPQLQQSIRLLQLSTLELNQEVEQMLDENPFLERGDEAAEREAHGLGQSDSPTSPGDAEFEQSLDGDETGVADVSPSADELAHDWDGDGTAELTPDDPEWGGEANGPAQVPDDDRAAGENSGQPLSLQIHLLQQASALRLSPEDRAALHFLIDSLNQDGYLEDSLPVLATALAADNPALQDELIDHFTVALQLLQSFEPAGVAARSLPECLRLQLRQRRRAGLDGGSDPVLAVAQRLCDAPLEQLARHDLKRLALFGETSEATAKEALALISRLNPKPGREFEPLPQQVIVPDVLVTRVGSGTQVRFRVQLNDAVLPRLRVLDSYAGMLKGKSGHPALLSRLQEARWFIKNIRQRFDTILRVSRAIVERQKSFLVHGELAMRPLVLREIADELGLHESTVSRVTTAKYLATPRGTYELKYFFGSALGTETGGNASSTAVRALIRQIIAAERPGQPLSDNQVSDMLREQGIACARRTVAKYRELLRIAPASLRKR